MNSWVFQRDREKERESRRRGEHEKKTAHLDEKMKSMSAWGAKAPPSIRIKKKVDTNLMYLKSTTDDIVSLNQISLLLDFYGDCLYSGDVVNNFRVVPAKAPTKSPRSHCRIVVASLTRARSTDTRIRWMHWLVCQICLMSHSQTDPIATGTQCTSIVWTDCNAPCRTPIAQVGHA